MNKLIKACIAMAAFAAFLVVPSIASATSPTLTQTTPEVIGNPNDSVPVGTKVIGTNVEHAGTALTTKLVSPVGNVECRTATVTGTVTKNSGGVIEGEVTTAEFRSKHTVPTHVAGPCSGGFGGDTSVTPSHTSALGIPWCMKASAEDKFEVRGGKCSEAAKALVFALHTSTLGTCSYERSVATGPVRGTYTTHPSDLIVTINGGANATFVKTGGSIFCPSHGELFMAFTLTTDLSEEKEGLPLNIT